MSKASVPSQRRPKGRPRSEEAPASLDDIFAAALTAFATHSYDRVSLRTLNREPGERCPHGHPLGPGQVL
jgi:TetR/AcrR family transcriptional regulator